MIILYLVNLACFPVLLVFGAIYFTRYFHLAWLNPLTALAGAALPSALVTSFTGPAIVLENGLFNPYFQYALLVNNVHETLNTVVLIVLVRFFHRSPPLRRFSERVARSGGPVKPERMRLAALAFLGLYFISFVLLAQHSFSVLQWIANPRTGYQFHRVGAGQWFASAILALSVSMVLMAIYQKSTRTVLVLSPLYIYLVYVLGSKGEVVNFAVFSVVALAIRQYRYVAPLALVLGTGAAALVAYSLLSALGDLNLASLASYSDGYTNAAMYYQQYLQGELPLLKGQLFVTNFWGIVPRALYPAKPYVYGVTLITDVFYPGAAEQTNTPAFLTVDYFADFGWIGVLLSAVLSAGNVLTAFLYALVLPRLKLLNQEREEKHFLFLIYAFLILAGPSFMVFFDFPTNIFLFLLITALLNVINRLQVHHWGGGMESYPEIRAER